MRPMNKHQIITEIEAFATKHGLAPSTVTGRAVGNSRLYQRMKNDGDCTTEVAARVIRYIRDYDATKQNGAA